MWVNSFKTKKKVKALSPGQMDACMMVAGKKESSMELARTSHLIAMPTNQGKASGNTAKEFAGSQNKILLID